MQRIPALLAFAGCIGQAAAQCAGMANGAICDDSNPATPVSICHAGECEATTFVMQQNSQCEIGV